MTRTAELVKRLRPVLHVSYAVSGRRARRPGHGGLGRENALGVPVIDHWWQTETGWTIAGNPVGLGALPVKLGSPTVDMPGYDIQVRDDEGHPVERGTLGNIVVKLPMPPGNLPTLWNAEDRFREAYLEEFPGYYKTADAGYMDEDGYLFIMARTDDMINVAGHRLSTGAMEEAIAYHPDVGECAVIGIADNLKGQIPAGFLVLNAGIDRSDKEIEQEVVKLVRYQIAPVAALQAGADRSTAAEDPLRQDPARNHAEDCRWRDLENAGNHRRSGNP